MWPHRTSSQSHNCFMYLLNNQSWTYISICHIYIYILSQWNKSHIMKVFSIIYLECPEKFRKIHWAVSASQHNSQGKLYIQGTSIYLAHFPFLKYGILDTNSVSASIWCRKSLTVFIYTDTVEIQGILGTSWWDLLGSLSWRSALAI